MDLLHYSKKKMKIQRSEQIDKEEEYAEGEGTESEEHLERRKRKGVEEGDFAEEEFFLGGELASMQTKANQKISVMNTNQL